MTIGSRLTVVSYMTEVGTDDAWFDGTPDEWEERLANDRRENYFHQSKSNQRQGRTVRKPPVVSLGFGMDSSSDESEEDNTDNWTSVDRQEEE